MTIKEAITKGMIMLKSNNIESPKLKARLLLQYVLDKAKENSSYCPQKVKVMITYSETSKTIPVYNEESTQQDTEETDSNGGTRKIMQTDTRKEVIYEEVDGNKTLITQSVISPEIEGAIVTAEGAINATVKANIVQAVEAVTGIATHKIQVFEMAS